MKGRTTNQQFKKQLDEMVQTLKDEIVSGHYKIGDCLPSERQLAARFKLGNLSVRKGLDILVMEDFIEKIPRVGNRIKSNFSRRVTLRLSCNLVVWRNVGLKRLVEQFQKLYPWITVEILDYSWNMFKEPALMPDVLIQGERLLKEVIQAGKINYLKPLTPVDSVYPMLNKLFQYQGKQYVIPLIFSPIVLFYNKSIFLEKGLPFPDGSWTWEDLIRTGESLTDGGRYGFCFHISDPNRWPIFLIQSGESFEWEGSKLKDIRGTKLLDSIKLLKRIVVNHKLFPFFITESNGEIMTPFIKGKLSMILTSYMGMNLLIDEWVDYDVAPIPFIHEPRTLMISDGVSVSASTEHPEEAQLFLDYLTSEQVQKLIQKHTNSIPSYRALPDLAEGEGVRRPGRFDMYRELLFSYRTHDALNLSADQFPLVLSKIKEYVADMIDEEELCDELSRVLAKQ